VSGPVDDEAPCPFCALLGDAPMVAPLPQDVVAERERAIAVIAPRWWPRNRGHALVVPRIHVRDLYGSAPLPGFATPEARLPFARLLRDVLSAPADHDPGRPRIEHHRRAGEVDGPVPIRPDGRAHPSADDAPIASAPRNAARVRRARSSGEVERRRPLA